jgi:hypothetical protein
MIASPLPLYYSIIQLRGEAGGETFSQKRGRAMKTERGELRFILRRKPKVGLLLLIE